MIDFFKAFDYLPHVLFIAKTKPYGLDKKIYKVNTRLSFKLHTKNQSHTGLQFFESIEYGVPQCSILDPIETLIYVLCELFFTMNNFDMETLADDNAIPLA